MVQSDAGHTERWLGRPRKLKALFDNRGLPISITLTEKVSDPQSNPHGDEDNQDSGQQKIDLLVASVIVSLTTSDLWKKEERGNFD